MLNVLNSVITAVSGVLYQPWCVPLLLLFGGIFLTIRLKMPQLRLFLVFQIVATLLVFVGAVSGAQLVWGFAELTQALMVLVNMPVVLSLSKYSVRCLNDYCKQKKEGKNPVFAAKEIGITEELDYWQ